GGAARRRSPPAWPARSAARWGRLDLRQRLGRVKMSDTPRIAIVGLGGLFPGAATPEGLWQNVLGRLDPAGEPPEGRWLLPAEAVHAAGGPRPHRGAARRGRLSAPVPGGGPGGGTRPRPR